MQAPTNLASAVAYTIIATRLGVTAWQVRNTASKSHLMTGFVASVLFLGACAAHHFGHAIDAQWTVFATKLCGGISLASSLLIWRLGRPMVKGIRGMHRQATHDETTGLHSRNFANRQLISMSQQAAWSIILVDIDHFKGINDTHGHIYGDSVLASVASSILSQIRAADIAIRWGGDEFLIILPGCEFKSAIPIAGKIADAIRSAGECTVSIGVTQYSDSIDSTLERADRAAYNAKNRGRDRVVASAP